MENTYPDKARGWVGFNVPMSHKITAACDILLMPSRFEPCGLNQLYAMAYGTVPVAHSTGGLRDTVIPFNPWDGASLHCMQGVSPSIPPREASYRTRIAYSWLLCRRHAMPYYRSISRADGCAGTGTGWTFSPCTVEAFLSTLGNVLETFREHPDSFRALQHRGMERNSSWDKAAAEYEQIFAWAKVDEPYCKT